MRKVVVLFMASLGWSMDQARDRAFSPLLRGQFGKDSGKSEKIRRDGTGALSRSRSSGVVRKHDQRNRLVHFFIPDGLDVSHGLWNRRRSGDVSKIVCYN